MKTLISRGVMSATMRKIRTIGIVTLILMMLHAVSAVVAAFITDDFVKVFFDIFSVDTYAIAYRPMTMLIFLPFLTVLGTFIMTIVAFSHLNKKDSSDFFGALPHKRETVLLSTVAAVTLTMAVIVAVVTAVVLILSVVLSVEIESISSLLMTALGCIAGAYLTAAIVAIATGISGTAFSNTVISLIIMLLPRGLVMLFSGVHSLMLPNTLIPDSVFTGSGSITDYNAAASAVLGLGAKANAGSVVYTVVLASIYTAIAVVLHRRRKSEIAGQAVPSKKLHAIVRITIGFAMFAAITAVLAYTYVVGGFENEPFKVASFIGAYLIAAVVYFAYELLATRSWKNVARASFGLIIVVLLSAGVYGGLMGAYNYEVNYCPDVEDIESVSFKNESYGSFLGDYLISDIEDYPATGSSVIMSVRQSLKGAIEEVKSNPNVAPYTETLQMGTVISKPYTVIIDVGGKKVERIIRARGNDITIIDDTREKCLEQALEDKTVELNRENSEIYNHFLTDPQKEKILDSAIDEMSRITVKEWRELEKQTMSSSLLIIYHPDSSEKEVQIPISEPTLPKTYQLFVDMVTKSAVKNPPLAKKEWTKFEATILMYVVDADGEIVFDFSKSRLSGNYVELVTTYGVERKVENGDLIAVLGRAENIDEKGELFAVPLEGLSEDDLINLANEQTTWYVLDDMQY